MTDPVKKRTDDILAVLLGLRQELAKEAKVEGISPLMCERWQALVMAEAIIVGEFGDG